MHIYRLPQELLDAIPEYIQTPHLPALAATATAFLPAAQRVLYRHLDLSPVARNLFLVPLLAAKPSLARHVRSFCLRTQSSLLFPSFYRQLATALSNMSELSSLDLFVDPQASWVLPTQSPRPYPRLSQFASSFPLDSHVVTFLTNADALLKLELDDETTPEALPLPPLPAASLPLLRQFIGSCRVANAIVPGRPVNTIHLLADDVTESDIVQLGKSTVPVIIFDANTSCRLTPLLDTLAHLMPDLVYLRLMTTYNFTDAPDNIFPDQISRAFQSLPCLESFELSGIQWACPSKLPSERQAKFLSHPSLHVDDMLIPNDLSLQGITLDQDIFFFY